MIDSLRFGNVAHIVAPKPALQATVMLEQQTAGNPRSAVWTRPYRPDKRYGEAVILSGHDWKEAGETHRWDFATALKYAESRVRRRSNSDKLAVYQQPSVKLPGTSLYQGQTTRLERATFYKYTPETLDRWA